MGCDGGCRAAGDKPARRNQVDEALGAPVAFPGDTQVSLDGPFSCVTVYAASNASPAPAGAQLIRLNLFAECASVRDLVASVLFPTGFRGEVIRVSGLEVDSWHVTMQASSPKATTKIVLQGDSCCAEPAIVIPPELQNPSFPEGLYPLSMLEDPPPGPKQIKEGLWRVRTEAGGNPVTLLRGERVVGLTLQAGLADATLAISGKMEPNQLITVPAGGALKLSPRGQLVGPALLTFGGGFLRFIVETVR